MLQVSSIRRNKAACRLVRAQQSAALALDIPSAQLRRGMVAISPQSNQPVACQYFQVRTLCENIKREGANSTGDIKIKSINCNI